MTSDHIPTEPGPAAPELTPRQRAYLSGLAQDLRPQLHLSQAGLTTGVLQALEDLFRGRELVKGRILRSAEGTPRELASGLAAASSAAVVNVVGRTFVLYRPNLTLKQRLSLPGAPSPLPDPDALDLIPRRPVRVLRSKSGIRRRER